MGARILLIEDEPSIADNVTYSLEKEGFECIWRATGAEGEAVVAQESVDLILLDVGLPDCNGFELCKSIRKSHDAPIIFLTARDDEIDRVVGLEIGADDYVVKPFSPRELCARIKAILRRTAKSRTQQVSSIPKSNAVFQVDEERCLIRYHRTELNLSRYEYRLLGVLINQPGRVFSRDKLMELVWDEPEASMDRTVDAHIKSLRAKLRAVNAGEEPIKTHRGMGYSLKEQP